MSRRDMSGEASTLHTTCPGETTAYRLWVDYTYAEYLWETLADICRELNGGVVGAGYIFPDLTES